jgi:hypothetical protein
MTTKKKLGRPKLPKGEAKTEILQIRLTKSEFSAIDNRAKKNGAMLSEWVRTMILNG